MKIDLIGPAYPYRGGIAHYTTRLARELEDQGHDLRLINFSRQYPSRLFPGTSQEDTSASGFHIPSVRWLDSMGPATWHRVARRIVERDSELVIAQWWHPFFAPAVGTIARLLKRKGIPTTLICHNARPHESTPFDEVLLRYVYGAASGFHVHAASEREVLRELVPDAKVSVAPHPVYDLFASEGAINRHDARIELGIAQDAEHVLFFGLIRPYKGVEILLDAALKTMPQRERMRLAIVGEPYGGREELVDSVKRLNLGGRVHLELRYVSNEEAARWMAATDVIVLPYRHATQSGIVQMAYAAGRPVITTRVGGLPEVVANGQSGLLVKPNDSEELAAAIVRFFDEGLGERLESGVVRLRQQFGWRALVRELLHEEKP